MVMYIRADTWLSARRRSRPNAHAEEEGEQARPRHSTQGIPTHVSGAARAARPASVMRVSYQHEPTITQGLIF